MRVFIPSSSKTFISKSYGVSKSLTLGGASDKSRRTGNGWRRGWRGRRGRRRGGSRGRRGWQGRSRGGMRGGRGRRNGNKHGNGSRCGFMMRRRMARNQLVEDDITGKVVFSLEISDTPSKMIILISNENSLKTMRSTFCT